MSGWTDAHERAFKVLSDALGWDFEGDSADHVEWVKSAVKDSFDELDKARSELASYRIGSTWKPRPGSLKIPKIRPRTIAAIKDGLVWWQHGETRRFCSLETFKRWAHENECWSD